MFERFTDSLTWYVCFDDTEQWHGRLLKPKFGHVRLFLETGGKYIMFDQMWHCFAFRVYDDLPACTHVLLKVVHYGEHYKRMPLEPLTCVTFAKRVLCIRNRWIQTPYQLYKELIKAGAFVID